MLCCSRCCRLQDCAFQSAEKVIKSGSICHFYESDKTQIGWLLTGTSTPSRSTPIRSSRLNLCLIDCSSHCSCSCWTQTENDIVSWFLCFGENVKVPGENVRDSHPEWSELRLRLPPLMAQITGGTRGLDRWTVKRAWLSCTLWRSLHWGDPRRGRPHL